MFWLNNIVLGIFDMTFELVQAFVNEQEIARRAAQQLLFEVINTSHDSKVYFLLLVPMRLFKVEFCTHSRPRNSRAFYAKRAPSSVYEQYPSIVVPVQTENQLDCDGDKWALVLSDSIRKTTSSNLHSFHYVV